MLTKDLVRVRATRQEVRPSYIDPRSSRLQERAALLLELARQAEQESWTRGELQAGVESQVVGTGVDHKLSRGLARVVLDRCDFHTHAPLEPQALRARLFALGPVARRAGVDGRPTAAQRMGELAAELGCEVRQVERALFADLKENQVLERCRVPDADWILHRYNVALVQALLLHASEVRVHLQRPSSQRARQLFRHVKFRQLMHRIQATPDGYDLVLDGPTSLFKMSTRYGLQLAQFFPALPLQPTPWRMEAEIRWRRYHRSLVVTHEQGLRSHLPDHGHWASQQEEWFEERFQALDSGWTLERGGDLLDLGGRAVVAPDFTFRKEGRVACMEVVGMWRRGYLERRAELLARHGATHLLLAVSRNLLGDKGKVAIPALQGRIIPFSRIIPPKDVLAAVEACAVVQEG